MFKINIFMCLIGFVLGKPEMDPMEIVFNLKFENKNNYTYITCDHGEDKHKKIKEYAFLEGEKFKIIVMYTKFINKFECFNKTGFPFNFQQKNTFRNETIFEVGANMGGRWKCTIRSNMNVAKMCPQIQVGNDTFSATDCYMNIHIPKKPPQTILVNSMKLKVAYAPLSGPNHFFAEYPFAAGDLVNVTCADFENSDELIMKYDYADKLSNKFNSTEMSSSEAVGFIATMYTEHNHSVMTCTNKGNQNQTTVMVQFIQATIENSITVNVNGKNLRYKPDKDYYEINYTSPLNQNIIVVCETKRDDMILSIVDKEKFPSNGAEELEKDKKYKIDFRFSRELAANTFTCGCNTKLDNSGRDMVKMHFSNVDVSQDTFVLDLELPPEGTAMELFYHKKLRVIYYDFKVGEELNLKCQRRYTPPLNGPITYLQYKGFNETKTGINLISESLQLTREHEGSLITFYLREEPPGDTGEQHKTLGEVRVIFREKVITTTTSTTSTTSTTNIPADTGSMANASSDASAESVFGGDEAHSYKIRILAAIVSVIAIIIICVSTVIIKMRKRNIARRGPHNRNYENLQNPYDNSIPAYPPQWDNNYAVPVDRRPEDATYSEPCQPEAAYAIAIPKSKRNKKNPASSLYASLDVKNIKGNKNVFKETDDPNYSEVYANRKDQCYAEVVPKNLREKLKRDNNPYANLGNESPYVNTAEPEPMYCEPNVASKAQNTSYANINNDFYANSQGPEYVEPTYCEPQGGKK